MFESHEAAPAWHRHGDRGTDTSIVSQLLLKSGACGESGCCVCPSTCRAHEMIGEVSAGMEKGAQVRERREFREERR